MKMHGTKILGTPTIDGVAFTAYRHPKKPIVIYRANSTGREFLFAESLWTPGGRNYIADQLRSIMKKELEATRAAAAAAKPAKTKASSHSDNYGGKSLQIEVDNAKHMPHAAVLAQRAWLVSFQDGMLLSTAQKQRWTPGVEKSAICLAGATHHAPHPDCACGIYAVRPSVGITNVLRIDRSYVLGEIYLWGRVLHGEIGFRAEKAYPKAFYVISGDDQAPWWTNHILGPFNVPIHPVPRFPNMFYGSS